MKPTTSATLAGIGAEAETESETPGTESGTMTVTAAPRTQRSPVLVSGGSATSGNRISITNIDTGVTTGNYRRVSEESSGVETVGTVSAENGDQNVQTGTVNGEGEQIEIVAPQTPETPAPEYRTVISACNIRSYPDYGDNVIGGLYGGETVLFYGEEAGWYKIEYAGIVGYIGPRFLQ